MKSETTGNHQRITDENSVNPSVRDASRKNDTIATHSSEENGSNTFATHSSEENDSKFKRIEKTR